MSPVTQRSQSVPLYLVALHEEQFLEPHWFRQTHWHCVASLLAVTVMARLLQSVVGEHARHNGLRVPTGHVLQSVPV